jgi:ATP-dependent Lhr-like helicase
MSHRLSRLTPRTLTVTANDYGIELRSPRGSRVAEDLGPELLGEGNLEADLDAAFNATELARRRFRSVAQIAGLVFPGYPGSPRGRRELQASATLFYEVFRAHDPDHVLLDQAEREVREDELLVAVVRHTMRRLSAARLVVRYLERPGPLAFPLLVKELAARVSSESLPARVERMKRRWSQEMSP